MKRKPTDDGSILPLVLGFAVLAVALVLVCASATSLYLAQQRLEAVADAAALAGADGFTVVVRNGEPVATVTDSAVRAQAEAILAATPAAVTLVSAISPDGRSARVVVAAVWHPPVVSVFVPEGVPLQAVAISRTGLF